jgi:polysaccharide chain length determinant protein (PEP-CTERM system associated)
VIPGKEYQPRDLLRIAWRRRWTILVPAIVVAGACAIWTWSLPDRYQSDALVLVVPQRVPESYVRSTVTARIENRLRALTLAVLSRASLAPIIQDLALYSDRQRSQSIQVRVERMRNDIDIRMVTDNALRVSFVASDGLTAMWVVQRLVSQLIEESQRSRESLADETNQFLETQLEGARSRLIDNERRIEAYRRRHGDEMPAQLGAIVQAQHSEEMRLQALLDSINRGHDRRMLLERMVADTSMDPRPAVMPATAVDGAPIGSTTAEQLRSAEASLTALLVRLTPEHPDVVRLTHLTAMLRQKADEEPVVTVPAMSTPSVTASEIERQDRQREMRAELSSLDQRMTLQLEEEKRVRAALVDYTKRINAMPMRESDLTDLMRDYQTLQENYRALLTKKEDSKVAADLEHRQIGEQFKILDAPHVPKQPSSPNRARLNLFGVLVGLGLGCALAMGLEWFDLTLRSESDVWSALNVPVVALIPAVACGPAARRNQLVPWLPHETADYPARPASNGQPAGGANSFQGGL